MATPKERLKEKIKSKGIEPTEDELDRALAPEELRLVEPLSSQEIIKVSPDTYRTIMGIRGASPDKTEEFLNRFGENPEIERISWGEVVPTALLRAIPSAIENVRQIPGGTMGMMRLTSELLPLTGPISLSLVTGKPGLTPQALHQFSLEDAPTVKTMIEFYKQVYNLPDAESREVLRNYIAYQPSQFLGDLSIITGPLSGAIMGTTKAAQLMAKLNSSRLFRYSISYPTKAIQTIAEPIRSLEPIVGGIAKAGRKTGVDTGITDIVERYRGELEGRVPDTMFPETPRARHEMARGEASRLGNPLYFKTRQRLDNLYNLTENIIQKDLSKLGTGDSAPDIGLSGKILGDATMKAIEGFHKAQHEAFQVVLGNLNDTAPANFAHTLNYIDEQLGASGASAVMEMTNAPAALTKLRNLLEKDLASKPNNLKMVRNARSAFRTAQGAVGINDVIKDLPTAMKRGAEAALTTDMYESAYRQVSAWQRELDANQKLIGTAPPGAQQAIQTRIDDLNRMLYPDPTKPSVHAANLLKETNDQYRKSIDTITSAFFQKVSEYMRDPNGPKYDKVAQFLVEEMSKSRSTSLISRGEIRDWIRMIDDPKAKEQLALQYMYEIYRKKFTDQAGAMRPMSVARTVNDMDITDAADIARGAEPGIANQLFGEEMTQHLLDISKMLVNVDPLERIYTRGSQTWWNAVTNSWTMANTAGILGALQWTANSIMERKLLIPSKEQMAAGAVLIFGNLGYAAFRDSDLAARLRTQGFDFPADMPKKVESAMQKFRQITRPGMRAGQTLERQRQLEEFRTRLGPPPQQ